MTAAGRRSRGPVEQTRVLIYLYTYLVHHVVGFPGPFANKRLDEMIEMNFGPWLSHVRTSWTAHGGLQRFGPHCNADQKEKKTASFSYVIGAQKFLRNHGCECQTYQFMEMFSSTALLAELAYPSGTLTRQVFHATEVSLDTYLGRQ